jgi:3-mercaptopyruvate sulfurtransferase SseA
MKKNWTAFAGLGALALALTAFAVAQTTGDKAGPKEGEVSMPKSDRMAMAAFKELWKKGEVVVIDVRSADAYKGGHIPGALSMPVDTLNAAAAEKLKRLGKPIATYCA